ncbi:hypothetical protein LT068_11540 [Vibrio cholerae]|uniref:MvdC/MvdD family ATP grasp protein n=1 Tax=Vibrio cholerae TaxID=666 RepID=UPI001E38033B|nr:hypothetical protein [Vibrio cholerae]MCD6669705.1 hypothetical protein [Vibrio cholerae]
MLILLITSSFDKTCDFIQAKYPDLDFFRLNVDEFSSYNLEYTSDGFRIERNNQRVVSSECIAVYFRKPTLEDLNNNIDVKYHNFVHKESYSLIEGLIESFEGKCLSKPSIMRRANNKVFQAVIASKVGFNIPKFSITNDNRVLKKWSKKPDAIVKPLSIGTVESKTEKEFVQTNIINPKVNITALKYSPVYLQKFVNKDYEVRVTVINGLFFPARIDSKNPIDWRKKNSQAVFTKWDIPEIVEQKCRDYMAKCSMEFGCFDFLVKDDIWYFLEMNVNGQWGWLDSTFNGKISDEIVKYLRTPI